MSKNWPRLKPFQVREERQCNVSEKATLLSALYSEMGTHPLTCVGREELYRKLKLLLAEAERWDPKQEVRSGPGDVGFLM